jgi:ceramide glucosyltransferase
MTLSVVLAGLYCALATLLHLATTVLVLLRTHRPSKTASADDARGVTLIRPVCGLDDIERETLATTFQLTHANLEVLFCAASSDDAAVPYLRELIARNPRMTAHVLIGNDPATSNPKLNNIIKAWHTASHDWIVMADSNLRLPADYIAQLIAHWSTDTGLVCAPPIANEPEAFWAEVECAFLNTYQARWQYAADCIGFGFAQGKTMMWRRADLDRAGGILALAGEVAEDAAATKVVRRNGGRVRLAGPSFFQPIRQRNLSQVLSRQARWAQLRRLSFPVWFAPEILTGGMLPLLACLVVANACGVALPVAGLSFLALWLGAEALLAYRSGWPLSWLSPLAWLMRDLLLPVVWVKGWSTVSYTWRGNHIDLGRPVDQT